MFSLFNKKNIVIIKLSNIQNLIVSYTFGHFVFNMHILEAMGYGCQHLNVIFDIQTLV